MYGIIPSQLSQKNEEEWKNYYIKRRAELAGEQPDITDLYRDSIVWYEFLRYHWSLSSKSPFPNMQCVEYAENVDGFGPDLRSISRLKFAEFSIRKEFKESYPQPTRKSKKPIVLMKTKKKSKVHRTVIHRSNAYTNFLQMKLKDLKDSDMLVQQKVSLIAKEWNMMTSKEKEKFKTN